MAETFESIQEKGLLIYRYIRGSHAYGLEKPDGTSDVDEGGVYIAPNEQIMGLPSNYQEEVSDERHDTCWYELGKFMQMLLKSNPTVLEALFIDEKFVLYEHPIMTYIKKHRQQFITKACFNPFIGYASDQIKKARGLNKKIVSDPELFKVHKQPLDFCYTMYRQGSTKIEHWLEHRHLKQKYCGLVKIPNMQDMYGLYYDFGNHIFNENWIEDDVFIKFAIDYYHPNWFIRHSKFWSINYLLKNCKIKPIGYRGIVGENDDVNIENNVGKPKIYDVRLSSIDDKNTKPLCQMSYNSNGYTDYCVKYKEYKDWEKNRNPERFKENQGKEFDRKNIAHCVRLLHMGIEIAKTGEVHVNRTNIDRDFILNIRLGNTTYDEIIQYISEKNEEMRIAMKESTLPDNIDTDFVNNLLIECRKKFFNT